VEPVRRAFAEGGRPGVVSFVLEQAGQQKTAPALMLAVLYGEAGRPDDAFHQLDRALDSHDPCLVHLAVAPQWDCLRADPRFAQRLERMGLARQVA
jgi:hypothetical protein